MFRRMMLSGMVMALWLCSPVRAQEGAVVAEGGEAAQQQTEAQALKNPVSQLRGKLLYKRNQARRMERAATEADAELKKKIDLLQSQIEGLYVEANPKLAEIYAEQKQLETRIEALNQK